MRLHSIGSEKPAVPAPRDAAYFDQWYADMAASLRRVVATATAP